MSRYTKAWQARFDENDHAIQPGWETYHKRPMFRFRVRCWFGFHKWPHRSPGSGSHVYDRCTRCRARLKWYVMGEHRYGGVSRYFSELER